MEKVLRTVPHARIQVVHCAWYVATWAGTSTVPTQPIIFGSDSDLIFFLLSDSRLNTDMIQNFFGNNLIQVCKQDSIHACISVR